MGKVLLAKNDAQGALAAINTALSLDPQNDEAYFARGRAFAKMGDIDHARQDWQAAVDNNRSSKAIRLQAAIHLEAQVASTGPATVGQRAVIASAPLPEPPQQRVFATAGKRLALVIGNGDYANSSALPNPPRDATAITSKLIALGFEVVSGINLDRKSMELDIKSFVQKAQTADITLFFYAGHGIQVGDENYLIPTDAKLEDATSVDFELINVEKTISRYMGGDAKTGIVILDSCRDNPLADILAKKAGTARGLNVSKGMAAMSAEDGGLLIAFATSPGQIAQDGDGQNSPFTTALLNHLDAPGIEIEQLLKRVKKDVYVATGKVQQPWVNSALRDEVFLVGR